VLLLRIVGEEVALVGHWVFLVIRLQAIHAFDQ
jgi:hypothetical protein